MGLRGPAPKPTTIKLLEGNPGQRPLNDREPLPRRGRPRCPTWLDEIAKREWAKLVPELDRLGLLTVVDVQTLAAWCQAVAEHEIATTTLQTAGRFYETQTDAGKQIKPHPAVAMQRSAWAAIKQFQALFGFSPATRTGLKVPDHSPEDDINDFIGKVGTGSG